MHNFNTAITGNNKKRSTFKRNSGHKTSFNAGQLIPLYIDEVLPGDTHKINTSMIIRQSTLIKPVMDNSYFDIFFFYIPMRLVWENWAEFMGENKKGHWAQTKEWRIPQIVPPNGGWNTGTIADYIGIPKRLAEGCTITSLIFKAYTLIWNEWFRDQNLQDPAVVTTTDKTLIGSNEEGLDKAQLGGKPLPVCKYHDYFTSCLKGPQKGEAVKISLSKDSEVYTSNENHQMGGNIPLKINDGYDEEIYRELALNKHKGSGGDLVTGDKKKEPEDERFATPTNLWANTKGLTAITINELRNAFQLQKMLEKDARGGTRYTEILRSRFGVISDDARLQRPEYLGGIHQPISINQVLQTAATNETTPQANEAANSLTGQSKAMVSKSFTEHGYIIAVGCVRTDKTYSQGLDKMFTRKDKIEFYDPTFANIGEQPIYTREIWAEADKKDVFGYAEAWADYRYKANRVSALMRPQADKSLAFWHYADNYKSQPTLSADWIKEGKENIDRTLAVTSDKTHQFIVDLWFENKCTRPMPVYSIPGNIDRN